MYAKGDLILSQSYLKQSLLLNPICRQAEKFSAKQISHTDGNKLSNLLGILLEHRIGKERYSEFLNMLYNKLTRKEFKIMAAKQ